MIMGGTSVAAVAMGVGFAWWRRGAPAPEVALQDLWLAAWPRPDGTTLTLGAFRPGGLVLNFWATWCPPCVREFPQLDDFGKEWAARGWRVVGVAMDNAAAVQSFLLRHPVSFDIAVAGADALGWSRALGNEQGGLPFTAVFAPGGHLMAVIRGETSSQALGQIAATAPSPWR